MAASFAAPPPAFAARLGRRGAPSPGRPWALGPRPVASRATFGRRSAAPPRTSVRRFGRADGIRSIVARQRQALRSLRGGSPEQVASERLRARRRAAVAPPSERDVGEANLASSRRTRKRPASPPARRGPRRGRGGAVRAEAVAPRRRFAPQRGIREAAPDPRAELEEAVAEARGGTSAAGEQAANVIASRIQAERRLDRAVEDHVATRSSAQAALARADAAERSGRTDEARGFTRAAEAHVRRLIGLDARSLTCGPRVLDATAAADRARNVVLRNADQLRAALSERERLLSRLDQAQMQELLNAVRAQLRRGTGVARPALFNEIRRGIDRRLAVAEADRPGATDRSSGRERGPQACSAMAGPCNGRRTGSARCADSSAAAVADPLPDLDVLHRAAHPRTARAGSAWRARGTAWARRAAGRRR